MFFKEQSCNVVCNILAIASNNTALMGWVHIMFYMNENINLSLLAELNDM